MVQEYVDNEYIKRLQIRFPFLKDKTKEEIFSLLQENKQRDPNNYKIKEFPLYERNLNKKFSPAMKKKIIERKAKKYFERWWEESYEEAYKRSVKEMMPTRQYTKFSVIANHVFEALWLVPNIDNIHFSINRTGGFSWYLKFDFPERKFCIKISDHLTLRSLEDKAWYPIIDTVIVNYKQNSYYDLNGKSLRKWIWWFRPRFNRLYDVIDEDIYENSIVWLKNFLRKRDISYLWDPERFHSYLEDFDKNTIDF